MSEQNRVDNPFPEVIQRHANPVPMQPMVPAGWHPDPQSPGILRYWDGYQWTEHRQPLPRPQATAIVYNDVRVSGGSLVGLHIVLTLLTCGAWLPVWLIIELIRALSK
jgi:hypothetical protein